MDIDRDGDNCSGDNEHYQIDDNGNVVSVMVKIVYDDYS